MPMLETDKSNPNTKLTVEEYVGFQTDAVRFLHELLVNESSDQHFSDERLKARVIAAQTIIASEPPLDTERFINTIRDQLHDELRAAGVDVDGALGEKKVIH